MSREELEALSEVLRRRLHNTRDPELQALLWQLTEYADEATANWYNADQFMQALAKGLDAYRSSPEE